MRVWATLRAKSKGVWIEGLSPLAMERAALGWGCISPLDLCGFVGGVIACRFL